MLFVHWARRAASRADCTAGSSSAIRTAMIAITTRSSISVKPWRPLGTFAPDIRPSFDPSMRCVRAFRSLLLKKPWGDGFVKRNFCKQNKSWIGAASIARQDMATGLCRSDHPGGIGRLLGDGPGPGRTGLADRHDLADFLLDPADERDDPQEVRLDQQDADQLAVIIEPRGCAEVARVADDVGPAPVVGPV